MKEKFKKQNGITLIALIISIIVMLILAAVSINIVMNQGIMTKSKTAADTHQVAAEKEAIELAYSKYLTEKYNGETNLTLTVADANVQENANEWTITFNAEPKNVYKLSKDGGEPEGPTNNGETTESPYVTPRTEVTYKGQTLKVGDYVNYDEGTGYEWTEDTSKETGTGTLETPKKYTTENMSWRVLGLDANGNLELISDKQTSEYLYLEGKAGYYNGEDQLKEMCDALYGKGTNAKSARSVNAEDINAILGYNKRGFKYEVIEDENTWVKLSYGYKLTYKETTTIGDCFKIGGSNEYTREGSYTRFTNIDGTVATDEAPITIESNAYWYERSELEDKVDSNILEMIFGKDMGCGGNNYFWLASRDVDAEFMSASWGLYGIGSGSLRIVGLYQSILGGEINCIGYVRPVVSLKSDVQLSGSSTEGWTIQ